MALEGIHHITAITADAPRNISFYVGLLGLRLVKRSVNQDDPTAYHLFYADERGNAGSDLTFFEYRGVQRGRAGDGMVHRIVWRVASEEALDFWSRRLEGAGVAAAREEEALRFSDPEGLDLELRLDRSGQPPLRAEHPEIPSHLALSGFDGVRAFSRRPQASAALLDGTLGFAGAGGEWSARGERRSSFYVYDEPPRERGLSGAGTVHHVAWASPIDEHEDWHARVAAAGADVTPIIDRYYFRSIYFREPSGVLFEIASIGPGFTVDEPEETLGQRLALPPKLEPLRSQLEQVLTPLPDPRPRAANV